MSILVIGFRCGRGAVLLRSCVLPVVLARKWCMAHGEVSARVSGAVQEPM